MTQSKDNLETNRLILRPLELGDAPDLVPLINDYEVVKWLTVVPHPYAQADAEWFIANNDHAYRYGISHRDTGRLMGVISIAKEFGYWLGRPFWGHGYMTEAAHALVRHWFDSEADALLSSHFIENEKSKAILEGLGFRETMIGTSFCSARDTEVVSRKMILTPDIWNARQSI